MLKTAYADREAAQEQVELAKLAQTDAESRHEKVSKALQEKQDILQTYEAAHKNLLLEKVKTT